MNLMKDIYFFLFCVRSRPRSTKSNIGDDVAVPDETFMTDFKNFSLQNTVTNIEGQLDSGDLPLDEDDDVLPQAAADMGTGKSKVNWRYLDRLSNTCVCITFSLHILKEWQLLIEVCKNLYLVRCL